MPKLEFQLPKVNSLVQPFIQEDILHVHKLTAFNVPNKAMASHLSKQSLVVVTNDHSFVKPANMRSR